MYLWKKNLIVLLLFSFNNLIYSLKCYKCANYGRQQNDFVFKNSCNSPTTNDQLDSCEAAYCFKSSVLMADLSSSMLRGCAGSDKIYELSTRLDGYQAQLNFCNSSDFCNSAFRHENNLFLNLFGTLFIIFALNQILFYG